jgi:hypothetical protein
MRSDPASALACSAGIHLTGLACIKPCTTGKSASMLRNIRPCGCRVVISTLATAVHLYRPCRGQGEVLGCTNTAGELTERPVCTASAIFSCILWYLMHV